MIILNGNRPEKPAGNMKKFGIKGAAITLGAVVLVLAAAVIAGGFFVRGQDTIYPNVTVGGRELGGMTESQAAAALNSSGYSDMAQNIRSEISMPDGSVLELSGEDVGLVLNTEEVADIAYTYGRDGSFLKNALTYLQCLRHGAEISSSIAGKMDEDALKSTVYKCAYSLEKKYDSDGFSIKDGAITIIKGSGKVSVDEEKMYRLAYDSLCESLEKGAPVYAEYELDVTGETDIDLQEIYDSVYAEAVSAVFNPETNEATQDVTGVSFDLEKAQRAYNAARVGEAVTIRLKYTEPEVTTAELNGLLFRDVLGEATTSLTWSSSNRTNNITLAAAAINGTVLAPGEEFSFNDTVGQRTREKGYLDAAVYVNGETVQDIGGGICQVSSSIYYCVLYSDLEVVSRSNHMFTVTYLPLGLDATVSWGSVDFEFSNNQDYPVKIEAFVEGDSLTVRLYGTKLDDNYIKLDYEVVSSTGYDTVYQEDESLAPGETKVKTSGHTGYVVNTYKYLYDAGGDLISKTYIARSSYRKQDKIILVAVGELPGQENETGTDTGQTDENEGDVGEDENGTDTTGTGSNTAG